METSIEQQNQQYQSPSSPQPQHPGKLGISSAASAGSHPKSPSTQVSGSHFHISSSTVHSSRSGMKNGAGALSPAVTIIRKSTSQIVYWVEFNHGKPLAKPPVRKTFSFKQFNNEERIKDMLEAQLSGRLLRASIRRNSILAEKQLRIKRQLEAVKYRIILQRQKERLSTLRLQAKTEYAQSSAFLKRQLLIRSQIERCGAIVEHAQMVAMMHKLKKYMTLKKSMSENFKDMIDLEKTQVEYEESEENDDEADRLTSPTKLRRAFSVPDGFLSGKLDEEDVLTSLGSFLPPITRFTLRELELEEIITNAQLRHDMFFDPNLQFRPNTDGERGSAKLAEADLYWNLLNSELEDGQFERVPVLLNEVKCILSELLPASEELTQDLEHHFDIKFIHQQIQHGIFNALPLMTHLASLLKENCAPARDEKVDSMVELCRAGQFGATLRTCFEVLEAMKLDYANHQLRKLRPFVVENAAEFEWKTFKAHVQDRKTTLEDTFKFMQQILATSQSTEELKSKSREYHFHTAIINLIMSANNISEIVIPETLRMDLSRLVTFYNDIQDVGIMATLLMLFKQACGSKCTDASLKKMKDDLWILLNDNDTSIFHIVLQIGKVAGDIRGREFTEKETSMLNSMIEKTLTPDSKLFDIIKKRASAQLLNVLENGSVDSDEILAKNGLLEMKQELVALAEGVKVLADHNKAVYGQLYNAITDCIEQGQDHDAVIDFLCSL